MKKKIIGIYAIMYKDQIIYIGQSNDVEHRVQQHFRIRQNIEKLYKNEKWYDYMTLSLKKNIFIYQNIDDITWKVLRECSLDDLNFYENYYIKMYKPVFNWEGVKCEYRGVKRDPEPIETEAPCDWEDPYILL